MPKPKNKNISLEIKNLASDKSTADLYIYGTIVDEDWWDDAISPKEIVEFLNEIQDVKELNLYISSDGGSVFAAVAIFNVLKRFEGRIKSHIDSIAASSASWLAMVAEPGDIYMPQNTMLFVHRASMCMCGNADDMLKGAEDLEVIENSVIIPTYENHMNISAEEIKELMKNETFISADHALSLGIIKEVGGEKELEIVENGNCRIINGVKFKLSNYKKFPDEFMNSTKKLEKHEEIDYSYFENHIKMTETVCKKEGLNVA